MSWRLVLAAAARAACPAAVCAACSAAAFAVATLAACAPVRRHEPPAAVTGFASPPALTAVAPPSAHAHVRVIGFNDFHGHVGRGGRLAGRPVGGAVAFAAHVAAHSIDGATLLVHAGDFVGASPPDSGLLQDEPSIAFLNLLGNRFCTYGRRDDPRCDLAGTVGNHELDEGPRELVRLLGGGNHPRGPFLENPWRGARYPTVCANVVDAATGRELFPGSVIKEVAGVRVGLIGTVLRGAGDIVSASARKGLSFLDEADAINREAAALARGGVRAIVVLIHQGGRQTPYRGGTSADVKSVTGPEISDIVARLDDEIDVVVSGHAHAFTNTRMRSSRGRAVLVTQAFSNGTAFAVIDAAIDRTTNDIIQAVARIETTWADALPRPPDPRVAALVAAAQEKVAPVVSRVIGAAASRIERDDDDAGESPLGNLVADAQRAAAGVDFAFMNPGGVRTDIAAGPVTWGDLFAVHPFGNQLVRMSMTGAEVVALLEDQWRSGGGRILRVSGLSYAWDPARPVGQRIVDARRADGSPVDPAASYAAVANDFLTGGGDGFRSFGTGHVVLDLTDLDALAAHIARLPQPFAARRERRIVRSPGRPAPPAPAARR